MAPLGLLIPGSTATQLRGRRPQRSELPGPGAVLLCPRGPEEVRRGLSLNSKAPMAAPGPAQGSVPLPAAASLGRGQATHPALIRDNRPPTGARFPQGFAPRDLPGLPWHNSEGCQVFRGRQSGCLNSPRRQPCHPFCGRVHLPLPGPCWSAWPSRSPGPPPVCQDLSKRLFPPRRLPSTKFYQIFLKWVPLASPCYCPESLAFFFPFHSPSPGVFPRLDCDGLFIYVSGEVPEEASKTLFFFLIFSFR